MPKKSSKSKNTTLLKLHGTPFKTAADLKAHRERLLLEEWQTVERARIRSAYLMKPENKAILAPLFNGLFARMVEAEKTQENLIHVFLTEGRVVQVDVSRQFNRSDTDSFFESLVKSTVSGVLDSYFTVIGMITDSQFASEVGFKNTNTSSGFSKSSR